MRNLQLSFFGKLVLMLCFLLGCRTTEDSSDVKPTNNPKRSARVSCTQIFEERRGAIGPHTWFLDLNFSGTCNNSAMFVYVNALDVPNTFTILDNNGVVVAQSSGPNGNAWIGSSPNSGPWNPDGPLNGPLTQVLSFTYNSSRTYRLRVETAVHNINDYWSVSRSCSIP